MKKTSLYGLKECLGSYIDGPRPNLSLKDLIWSTPALSNGPPLKKNGILSIFWEKPWAILSLLLHAIISERRKKEVEDHHGGPLTTDFCHSSDDPRLGFLALGWRGSKSM